MKVLKKKALSAILVLSMILGLMGTKPLRAEEFEETNLPQSSKLKLVDITDKVDIDALREKKYQKQENEARIDTKKLQTEKVTLIVELEDKPLLDEFTTMKSKTKGFANKAFSEYLKDSTTINMKNKLEEKQEKVIDIIDNAKIAADSDVLYQYTSVINGFAIRAERGVKETIEGIPGVKNVYEGLVYDHVLPDMNTTVKTIQALETWDLGYTGEKMIVAVIDTGLDTTHEAFSVEPAKVKMSLKNINAIMNTKALNSGVTNARDTYFSAKVPYTYDYADHDTNVNPTPKSIELYGNEHGTHVAGTVAGNDGKGFLGVAPDAQLIIMKVFSDEEGGAYTEDILAALEDTIILGADVINMSLGSTAGFSTDDSSEGVYDRLTEAGILVANSAGNSASMSDSNLIGGAFASNPDTATVGSASTYHASTSVASVNNAETLSGVVTINGIDITYNESAEGDEPLFENLEFPLEIVPIGDLGDYTGYEGIDVEGKIALVQRGSLSFNDKAVIAKENGAIAIIVGNNQAGVINMAIDDYYIPAISITLDAYNQLLEEADTLEATSAGKEFVAAEDGGLMSDFSSWGCTPDLKLKPEIAAPGGNILSSVPFGNSYASYSGTSMASPHIAGTYALLKQYMQNNDAFTLFNNKDFGNTATQILMSTAEPILDANGVYYSPRQQGSGLVNIYRAVNTNAYLRTVEDIEINGRPKLELGDDAARNGVYNSSFEVMNIGDEAISYDLSASIITETAMLGEFDDLMIGEQPFDISDYSSVRYFVNNEEVTSLTVPADSFVKVDVEIEISDDVKEYLDSYFVNGEFVEGFIFLDTDSDIDLSLPFMGFYGDWTAADIFDRGDANNQQVAQQYTGGFYTIRTNPNTGSEQYMYLGVNAYDYSYALLNNFSPYYDRDLYEMFSNGPTTDKLAISPNEDTWFDTFDYVEYSLLRNAREFNVKITGQDGTVYLEDNYEDVRKSFYSASYGLCVPFFNDYYYGWAGTDENGNVLPNDTIVNLTLEAKLDYPGAEYQTLSYELAIDTEAPNLYDLAIQGDGPEKIIYAAAFDNQFVSSIDIYDWMDNNVGTLTFNDSERGGLSIGGAEIETELTSTDLFFVVSDYAENSRAYMLQDTLYDEITGIELVDVTYDGFTVAWDESDDFTSYDVIVTDAYEGTVAFRTVVYDNEVVVTGLEEGGYYFVEVEGYYTDSYGDQMLGGYGYAEAFTYARIHDFEITNVSSRSFDVTWTAEEDYDDYLVTVYTMDDSIADCQIYNNTLDNGNPGTGTATVNITNLNPGTAYYVEITASNVYADAYVGAEVVTKNEYTVNFYDFTGKLFDSQTVVEGEAAITPASDPFYPNYIFTGWNADYSSVTSDLNIYPTYEVTNQFTLTVKYFDGTEEITQHSAVERVTVSAPEVEDMDFVGWKNLDGIIVSSKPNYSFYIFEDITLEAVYHAKDSVIEELPMPVATISDTVTCSIDGAHTILYFSAQAIIPQDKTGFSVVEIGTLRTKNDIAYTDDGCLTMEDVVTGKAKKTIHSPNSTGQYILGIRTSLSGKWDVVAYIKYIDKTTNEEMISYSKPVSMIAPSK